MRVGSNGLFAKQPIVVRMAADPEPHEAVRRFDCERSIVTADPSGPEASNLLELKRRIPGILLEVFVGLIGEFLNLRWQRSVAGPESGRRVMRDGSEPGGLAGGVVAKSLLSKGIESAVLDISFELAIPRRPVVFQKPSAERGELVGRERLHILLDLLNLAHDLHAGADSLAWPPRHGPKPFVVLPNVCAQQPGRASRALVR